MLRYSIIIPLILLCSELCAFQEDTPEDEDKKDKNRIELAYHLAAGYSFGGQMFDEVFIFESGTSFQFITDIKASSKIYYGLGIGYEKLDSESFLPLYFSFKGLSDKKDQGPYLSFKMGYSFAWDKDFELYDNYEHKGGLLFGAGIGRMFEIKDTYKILFNISFNHQFVRIDYNTFDDIHYTESINYDMFTFSLGIML
jgi:hypothetical protein